MYYYLRTLDNTSFEEALKNTKNALDKQGFGILTEIDIQATMKKKLDKDMGRYTILGACNPSFAYKALQSENKIGTMLPCNVIVRETAEGKMEVAAINPVVSMQPVAHKDLEELALQVGQKLRDALKSI